MIGALTLALLLTHAPPPAMPRVVIVATARGEHRLPVRLDGSGAPLLSAAALMTALDGTARRSGAYADLVLARQTFRLYLDAPLYRYNSRLEPLAASARVANDSLFIPLQFVAEVLPRLFGERYRYDDDAARLVEVGGRGAPVAAVSAPAPTDAARLTSGLRRGHVVTVDPGHGGVDPGNPGLFFPRGLKEKDVTLQVGALLRDELRRRGIGVRMTRTTDTLIALSERGSFCERACDLFVSLHVNSLPRRAGYTATRGFATYFLAEAKTEEAARVAKMENEAVRYESTREAIGPGAGLDFILKDLQLNEQLRESAVFAHLVQDHLGDVHPGGDRGVKQAGFMVLTTARRPAVLIEMGYSTNPEDGRLLTNPASQRKMAGAIADAVVAYLLEYERRTGVGVEAEAGR